MRDQDWALLGIAPTTELSAIKKAYALKLKSTRPDDDTEAYQALRGAYERAQQSLKLQGSQQPETDELAEPAGHEPLSADVAARVAVDDELPPPPDSVEYTVQRLHTLWQQHGSPWLVAEWPALRITLEAQPLASQSEWSAHFARWVVHQANLPNAFVEALNAYFGWQQDFRAGRDMGKRLAEALRQSLSDRQSRQRALDIQQAVRDRHPPPEPPKPPEPPSEALKARVRPLLELDELRFSGTLARRLALALRPMLARVLYGTDPKALEQCGVNPLMRESLDRLLAGARLLRAGLLGGLVWIFFLLMSDDMGMTAANMMIWCTGCFTWLGISHVLGALMHGLPPERPDEAVPMTSLQRWRLHERQPAVGLGCVAVAGVLAVFSHSWDLTAATLPVPDYAIATLQMMRGAAPWLLLCLGAMLAWPLNPIYSPTCIGLLVPVSALLFHWASTDAPRAAVIATAMLYVLVGTARFEDRLRGNFLLDAACRPITSTLTLAQRWGWPFAMLPSLLTLAYLLSSRPHPPVTYLVLAWVLLTLALHQLQHRAETWALARLNRA